MCACISDIFVKHTRLPFLSHLPPSSGGVDDPLVKGFWASLATLAVYRAHLGPAAKLASC